MNDVMNEIHESEYKCWWLFFITSLDVFMSPNNIKNLFR